MNKEQALEILKESNVVVVDREFINLLNIAKENLTKCTIAVAKASSKIDGGLKELYTDLSNCGTKLSLVLDRIDR